MDALHIGSHGEPKALTNRAGSTRRIRLGLVAFLLVGVVSRIATAARTPTYHLLKKMNVGGEGGWDYLVLDPQSRRLYLTHSDRVVVMDADAGSKVGEIANTPGVHGVALARGWVAGTRATAARGR